MKNYWLDKKRIQVSYIHFGPCRSEIEIIGQENGILSGVLIDPYRVIDDAICEPFNPEQLRHVIFPKVTVEDFEKWEDGSRHLGTWTHFNVQLFSILPALRSGPGKYLALFTEATNEEPLAGREEEKATAERA